MTKIIIGLILMFSVNAFSEVMSAPNDMNEEIRTGWGLGVGFGVTSYTKSTVSLRVLTPGYLKLRGGGWMRYYTEAHIKNLVPSSASDSESFSELGIGISTDSPVMNDIFSYYTRIGLGVANLPDTLYDGTVVTLPIVLGFNFYSKMGATRMSWDPVFGVEYRHILNLNYDKDKEIVSGAHSILGSALYFTISYVF